MFCIREVFLRDNFSPLCSLSNFKSFPSPKQTFKINLLSCKRVYITLASIFSFYPFSKSQESELTNLIVFLLLNTNIKDTFPITLGFPEILYQKSKSYHKYRYISIAITLSLMKFIQYF